MGLFDSGAKKEAAENFVREALSKLPILDDLICTIVDNEEDWLTNCQGYYDSRKRKVTIAADLFQIKWSEHHYEGDRKIIDVDKEICYSYTASGYTPIHNHLNEKGKEDVSVGRVIYIWASLIREQLKTKLQCCEFNSIWEYDDYVTFEYVVPALAWKRWF